MCLLLFFYQGYFHIYEVRVEAILVFCGGNSYAKSRKWKQKLEVDAEIRVKLHDCALSNSELTQIEII